MFVTGLVLGRCNTHTYSTPDKDPTTDQHMDTTQIQLGEPVSFIGFMGAQMTKVLLHCQGSPQHG